MKLSEKNNCQKILTSFRKSINLLYKYLLCEWPIAKNGCQGREGEWNLTNYEEYIRANELLNLQKTEMEMCCRDELTFQTIRQISELHFKLIIQYMNFAKEHLESKEIKKAIEQLNRVDIHLKHLPEVINLIGVIKPKDYHMITKAVGIENDFDSPGFQKMLQLARSLWEPFKNLLEEKNLTVLQLLRNGELNILLFDLLQELIVVDEGIQTLCFHYLKTLQRMEGKEYKEEGTMYGLQFELFPELWHAISVMAQTTFPTYSISAN